MPVEVKRKRGNPGRRPLPESGSLVELVPATETPEPVRPLGQAGRDLWDRIWGVGRIWISKQTDIELFQTVCEQVDERVNLRFLVLRDGDLDQRRALRDLDKLIVQNLSLLGLTPTDRTRLGVAEVKAATKMEALRARKAERLAAPMADRDHTG